MNQEMPKKHGNLEIIKVEWLNSSSVIGVVKCKDKITEEIKYYVKDCQGLNLEKDIKHIIDFGCKVTQQRIKELL